MAPRLINRPCTLVYRSESGETDELGNDIPAETRVEAVCELQQSSSDEAASGSPASSEWDGFFLPGVDLENVDAISVPGAGMFEVIGDASEWRSAARRRPGHVEATLRRTGDADEEEGS